VALNEIGAVQVAHGDLPAALTSYRASLAIRERLAKADPANVQWQIDVAVSCSKLGLHSSLSTDERRGYLQRGLEIQQLLKTSGRLPPNQDWTGWFDKRLKELSGQ
jgi:hypothetical protein